MAIPLATLSCTVDVNGISAPSYADIYATLQYQYKQLYGQDVDLDADTQDGQWLAVMAAAFNDSNNATIAAFNARSPASAQGAGLSSVVKLNGLLREASSNSAAVVTVIGVTGTTLNNCLIGDNQGLNTRWAIPNFTIIGDDGQAVVTATCLTDGNITAEAHTLNQILTPTLGWQTVDNVSAALPGAPVEDDGELRLRQSISQDVPSQSPAAACLAAIRNLPGVGRSTYDENTGGSVDGNGVPGHSIAYVVEGGDVVQIAQTIQRKKTIGTGTYGTTSELVLDPAAVAITINFFELVLDTIAVVVNVSALPGYSDATNTLIITRVSDYISSLDIGSPVFLTKVIAIASLMDLDVNTTFDVISVTLNGFAADVFIPFNHAAVATELDVTVNVS